MTIDYRTPFTQLGRERKALYRRALELDVAIEQYVIKAARAQLLNEKETLERLKKEFEPIWKENEELKAKLRACQERIDRILKLSDELGLGLSRELLA